MRVAVIAVPFLMALASAGCGGGGKPLPITTGMAAEKVRAVAGRPARYTGNFGGGACWFYDRTKTGKKIA
jgi:hypothetical protein